MMRRSMFLASATSLAFAPRAAFAQELVPLDVAYAGSMGALVEGPLKTSAQQTLRIDVRGRAQGSDALAKLIVGGSIFPDVFMPVTPVPMLTVLTAGKARVATPVARTEMVIAYSPKSKYAPQFADAAAGKRGAPPWWRILQESDVRFGRTDPATDPQGRNIIFTLQLAEAYYAQPGLAQKVLGETLAAAQIFSEPTVEARLQSGELDAASAYRVQPAAFGLPYIRLPREINLADAALHAHYERTSLQLDGKTYRPQPLVYYAAVLEDAARKDAATTFVAWLAAGAREIFGRNFYDPPAGALPLRA